MDIPRRSTILALMNWDRGAGVLPTTHRFMSASEYYEMPEGPPYFQLIEGELLLSPSPRFFHQRIVINLLVSIENFLRRHSLGKIMIAPSDVELDTKNVYQPDLYFVSNSRSSLINKQGVKGAPDFVVEAISASTGRLDLGPKKKIFARRGVREFWAVFPESKEVKVWKLAESVDDPVLHLKLGDSLSTEILPGWKIMLEEIFAE